MMQKGEAVQESSALAAFAERATDLLTQLAREADPALARAYDELLFDVLHDVVRRRGAALAARAATGSEGGIELPRVRAGDLDEISLDVTVAALERARRTADRFDPERGDGASWALGAAGFAYIDVVRSFYQTRRKGRLVPVDPVDLGSLMDQRHRSTSPEDVAVTRAALVDALGRLDEDERFAILARAQYTMSYAEIATYLFGSPTAVKAVDGLLQRARRKLAQAEEAWNGSTA
jgi:RNA polymerase sigma factor (sigma-70 family)